MRTTVDIDDPILKELKRLQKQQDKSLGRLVSDLLAQSLATMAAAKKLPAARFEWNSQVKRARVDLADTSALLDAMDRTRP